jgi:endothelin-converting enzyme
MDLRLLVDSHSPNHMRVNNAVSNFPEFARAWKCRKNSPLNLPSSQRCSLW